MRKRVNFGLIFLVFGLILTLIPSLNKITGKAVVIDGDGFFAIGSSFIGLILIIAGIVTYLNESRLEDKLKLVSGKGEEIFTSDRFEKSIRKHDKTAIYRALKKIGTGLGHEHHLEGYKNKYSISVTKGARVVFDREGGKIVLDRYLSDHDYKKLYGE